MARVAPSAPQNHSTVAVAHQQFIDPPWVSFHTIALIEPESRPTPPVSAALSRPTSRKSSPTTYKVVSGDSLSAIAEHFKASIYNLATDNHMQLYDVLLVGRMLTLPRAGEKPAAPMAWSSPYSAELAWRPSTHVVVAAQSYGGGWTGPWACIAAHESGGNPADNTGNGYYGGLQFSLATWQANGGTGNPANASIAEQEAVANRTLASGGWGQWPQTSVACGY